jgi:hypothetical protein
MLCQNTGCAVGYDLKYTPLHGDTIPNEVYWGARADVIVNTMASLSMNEDDMDPLVDIKIDTTRQDYEGLIDAGWSNLNWRYDAYPFYVSD